jgi:hypothetical protein
MAGKITLTSRYGDGVTVNLYDVTQIDRGYHSSGGYYIRFVFTDYTKRTVYYGNDQSERNQDFSDVSYKWRSI